MMDTGKAHLQLHTCCFIATLFGFQFTKYGQSSMCETEIEREREREREGGGQRWLEMTGRLSLQFNLRGSLFGQRCTA